ncbi:MAG: hypothetical protein J7518_10100 [Nocardioidaceae bacterium]|nr:hypothetical protein [Nocardioidaceae bacterium]
MNANSPNRTLTEDLLARAAEDWVSAAEVIDLVRQAGVVDPSDCRDLAVGLIARLLGQGLISAGDIEGVEHSPWPLSTAEAILRIASEWASEEDPFVMPGSIVWLNTTPRGQVIGEGVWRRESQP